MVCIARVYIFEICKIQEKIMAWLKVSDTFTTHPLMMRLLGICEGNHQLKNEASGVLLDLASISAEHLMDYYVEYGALAQVAPGREDIMIDLLSRSGLLFEEQQPDGTWMLRLVDDPGLFHMRSREEVELDRRRSKDKRNPDLLMQVRLRDGDQCRWCGKTVDWRDRRSRRRGTYDSLNGHRDSTAETLVVACWSCNSRRGAGEVLELQDPPTPEEVHYNKYSIEFINNSQYAKDRNIHVVAKEEREKQHKQSTRAWRAAPQPKATVDEAKADTHDTPPRLSGAASVKSNNVSAPGGFSDPVETAPDWAMGEELSEALRECASVSVGGSISGSDREHAKRVKPARARRRVQRRHRKHKRGRGKRK